LEIQEKTTFRPVFQRAAAADWTAKIKYCKSRYHLLLEKDEHGLLFASTKYCYVQHSLVRKPIRPSPHTSFY